MEKRKIHQVVVDTIPQEYQNQDFKQIWFGLFGQEPQILIGEFDLLRKLLSQHFKKIVDLWIQEFELKSVGMGQVATELRNKIQLETQKIVDNLEELLGYKKLPDDIKKILEEKAKKEGKFLNRYPLYNYHSVPPTEVIDAIKQAKPYFPTLEIWAIEDKQFLRDPVVVGIKWASKECIYFIASWGDDIKVDDLFKKK